jgi:MYXO-CTERM domain-containing protein
MGHSGLQGDRLSQFFATNPGELYTVSFYVHCIQGDDTQVLTAQALAGELLGQVAATVSSRTQGWVNFTFDFTATGPSTELRFVHTTGAAGANIALDTVTAVPAPGAATLLGLAGLAARRRSRR